jgi:tRNA-2-methylthio-N6-dimethylallyladenosine synthase
VKSASEAGLRDITLLGQNVNSYQYDGYRFPDLLRKLNDIESLWRLRFVTSHPKDLSDELISAMAGCTKVCEHIHLPLQAGDDQVLKNMNRSYNVDHYLGLIDKLRTAIPNIAITTDLMVGFPGESEAQFENTLRVMESIRFDYAFCFKYSEREGTKAASYKDQVPEDERLRRLQTMIELQRQITFDKFQEQVGKTVEVYVEDFSRKSQDMVSGKTRDFKIAVLSGGSDKIGGLSMAKVVDATTGTLICH